MSTPTHNFVAADTLVLGLIGGTWGVVREDQGYSPEDAVRRIKTIGGFDIDVDDLILFEKGWIDPHDYREGLIEAIGKAYGGQEELVKIQMEFFDKVRNRPKRKPNT